MSNGKLQLISEAEIVTYNIIECMIDENMEPSAILKQLRKYRINNFPNVIILKKKIQETLLKACSVLSSDIKLVVTPNDVETLLENVASIKSKIHEITSAINKIAKAINPKD